MPNDFDESLIARKTPWAACAALEDMFATKGRASVSDNVNWVGIAFTCATKANGFPLDSTDSAVVLGWAHLAISIRESLACTFTCNCWGILHGAMVVRMNMVIRYGNHLGDYICDCKRVVDWCLSCLEVRRFLEMETIPRF